MNQALLHNIQNNNAIDVANSAKRTKQTPADVKASLFHGIHTQDSLSESFELIKVLRNHQQSGRWTVLIAPQNIPDKALLTCCSVDMSRVLVVHTKHDVDVSNTIANALSQSTCSAVVAWTSQISNAKLQEFAELAGQSGCHFYAFNRSSDWIAQH